MPKFQQHHYEAIADVTAATKIQPDSRRDQVAQIHMNRMWIHMNRMWEGIVCDLATMFAADNSKFLRTRFTRRCGYDG